MTAPVPAVEDPLAPTPSAVGYGVALVLSWVFVTTGSGLFLLADGLMSQSSDGFSDYAGEPGGAGDLLVAALGWALLILGVGIVTGPLGAFLVHLSCRSVQQQWVHVVASFTVGAVAGAVVGLVAYLEPGDVALAAVGVGAATAVARAAVIPDVPAVRASYPPGTPWWRRFRLL